MQHNLIWCSSLQVRVIPKERLICELVAANSQHLSGWGIHVTPWLIHVNVWQKPLQYCKVISLQLIKKKKNEFLSPEADMCGDPQTSLMCLYVLFHLILTPSDKAYTILTPLYRWENWHLVINNFGSQDLSPVKVFSPHPLKARDYLYPHLLFDELT